MLRRALSASKSGAYEQTRALKRLANFDREAQSAPRPDPVASAPVPPASRLVQRGFLT